MTASCSANTNGNTTWSWTKNGSAAGSGTTLSDSLPANALTTSVTTTYQVTATNAGATPTVTTQGVTVVGTGGGGGAGPTLDCSAAGFSSSTKVMDLTYPATPATTSGIRQYTTGPTNALNKSWGYNFGNSDMIIVRFVAQGPETDPGSMLTIGFSGQSASRIATLSTQPCDVATVSYMPPAALAAFGGPSVVFHFNVDPGSFNSSYTKLTKGVTYYLNIVNRVINTGAPSCSSSNCPIYIDFN